MNSAPVLAIIDNKDSRELAVELLEYAGFPVVEANTAANGLRMVRQHRPRAIIIDVFRLADFDGLQLMHVLHNHPETRSIPIIAMACREDWYELEGAGFAAIVDSPIELDGFSGAVASVIGSPQVAAQELG